MASPRAIATFRETRPEIAELIKTCRTESDTVAAGHRMSSQENHLRLVVVALIGALQAYVAELLEEQADELGDSWDSLGLPQKRYLSVQTVRRLSVQALIPESDFTNEKKIEQLQTVVQECAGWCQTPSLLARSACRQRLDGFLADNGTKALDRAVSQFGKGGLSFFNWLTKNYPRYRGISDLLDSMIALRNDVAHGTFNRRVTFREVRVYRTAVYRLVGRIEAYQKAN